MSTEADRLQAIKDTYDDASGSEAADLAKAQTAADVAAIQANVANARATYYAAVAAMLSESGPAVETAYTTAQSALKAVKDARAKAEAIPTFIGKLANATNKATDLLNKAKKLG